MENILMTSRKKDWIGYSDEGEKKYHLSKQSQETGSEDRDSKNGITPQCLKMIYYSPLGSNKLVCLKYYFRR